MSGTERRSLTIVLRSTSSRIDGLVAITVAVRRRPEINPISPKNLPGPSFTMLVGSAGSIWMPTSPSRIEYSELV